MHNSYVILVSIILTIVVIVVVCSAREKFNIPLRESSAWDWNLGPGYGAGYGTGYSMYGEWPAMVPGVPWKSWMWGRRPLIFRTPFTPVPQIDYNTTPSPNSIPESNYNISILPVGDRRMLSINGVAGKTLQLDRHRPYYFHVYAPGTAFSLTDGVRDLIEPIEEGTIQINFSDDDPGVLYYSMPGILGSGGVIYLNSTKWV